tara:strand:+ start:265 stop:699 length:435 start_codon:yes stop_codon:yes gene_type:complete
VKKILIITLLFLGCTTEPETADDCACPEDEAVHELVGSWEKIGSIMTLGTFVDTVFYNDYNNEILIYSENNTFSYTRVSLSSGFGPQDLSGNGTWSTTEGKLTMIEDGETTVWDYEITSGVFTKIYTNTANGQTGTLEYIYNKK